MPMQRVVEPMLPLGRVRLMARMHEASLKGNARLLGPCHGEVSLDGAYRVCNLGREVQAMLSLLHGTETESGILLQG